MESELHGHVIERILEAVEYIALGIEIFAIGIIVVGIGAATRAFLERRREPNQGVTEYERYRANVGRTLLLGLEVLVAADVVRTVVLRSTLESIAALGILVLIRTFLSWSLEIEIENRWPWQSPKQSKGGTDSQSD